MSASLPNTVLPPAPLFVGDSWLHRLNRSDGLRFVFSPSPSTFTFSPSSTFTFSLCCFLTALSAFFCFFASCSASKLPHFPVNKTAKENLKISNHNLHCQISNIQKQLSKKKPLQSLLSFKLEALLCHLQNFNPT